MSSIQNTQAGASVVPTGAPRYPIFPMFPNKTYPPEKLSFSEKIWKVTLGKFPWCKKNKKKCKKTGIVLFVLAIIAIILVGVSYFFDVKKRAMMLF